MREPAPLQHSRDGLACHCSVEPYGRPEAASCCTEIGCEETPVVSDIALAAAQRFLFVAAVFCVCVVVLLLVKIIR